MKQGACYRDPQSQAVDLLGPLMWPLQLGPCSWGGPPLLGFKDAWDTTEPALGEPLIFEKERAGDVGKRNMRF